MSEFFAMGEDLALGTQTDDFADLAGPPLSFWQRIFRRS